MFVKFPKTHIKNSIFAIGKVDKSFSPTKVQTAQTAFKNGEIIALKPIYADNGTLIAQGNPELLKALIKLKVISRETAGISELVLSPIRDASPYGSQGETLHNRSIFSDPSSDVSPESGAIVWKGTGTPGKHQTSIPFGIGIRSELSWAWLEGGMLEEEVSVNVRQADLLHKALDKSQALDQTIPNDLFFEPIISIAPVALPFKAAGNFSYFKSSLEKKWFFLN